MPDTKHRYKADTDSPEFREAFRNFRTGQGPEPEFEDVEIIEIDTPNGPRRVWADRADAYRETLEAAASEDLTDEEAKRRDAALERTRNQARASAEARVTAIEELIAELEQELETARTELEDLS